MSAFALHDGRTLPFISAIAVGVLVMTAALFAAVGVIRDTDGATTAAAPVGEVDGSTTGGGDDGQPGAGAAVAPSDAAEGPTEVAESAAEQPAEPGVDAAEVAPGDVSVQVLDAVGDGGTAAASLADGLRADGFDVIVVNSASRQYEDTTVYWSPGQGPGGRAVAAAVGSDNASSTPDDVRLTDSVDVHVVVGVDAID